MEQVFKEHQLCRLDGPLGPYFDSYAAEMDGEGYAQGTRETQIRIMRPSATLAALLESFFTQRLMNQRQASPHTISSYRDTFRLLLQFAQQRLHKSPTKLAFEE